MRRKGYSLIELLVVIGIIGVLATLGTYAWTASGKRSSDSVRKADLSRMKNALQQFYLDHRSYPSFDGSQLNGDLYLAGYQLASNTACAHTKDEGDYLTARYLPEIPQDPKRSINFKTAACSELDNQRGHYLYLGGPKNSANPRQFALLATLEMTPQNELIPSGQNPVLDETTDVFRDYWISGSDVPYNPNYMVTGNSGR